MAQKLRHLFSPWNANGYWRQLMEVIPLIAGVEVADVK
jgi:hypothetical protein